MITIQKAVMEDMPRIRPVYAAAREFMAATGNPNQWKKTNPTEEVLTGHIRNGNLYLVLQDELMGGVFAFIPGEDPTYQYIEGGWHSDAPYAAIHCVAGNGTIRGLFAQCVAFCEKKCGHLRIDTHRDNRIMQRVIERQGFSYCGVIYLANGDPRLAYDRIK